VIGVVGGTGGSGASVLAAALSVSSARRGHSTVLVDADPMSGGLDLVLGCENLTGARWQHLTDVTGVLAADDLRTALPSIRSGASRASADSRCPSRARRGSSSRSFRIFDRSVA